MINEADKLNIIGNELDLLAEGLFVLAARTQAEVKLIQDKESQELVSSLANTFNIAGAWLQLLGDYILFKAAELQFEENLKANEPFDIQSGKLNVLVSEAQVIIDILEVQLAEKQAD
jgi:hypothetical protein